MAKERGGERRVVLGGVVQGNAGGEVGGDVGLESLSLVWVLLLLLRWSPIVEGGVIVADL